MLNTAEAADLLGVSEASVRRWGDAGLFPMQRVGKRQDRRFQRAHLEAFLAGGSQTGTRLTSDTVTIAGAYVPAGTHVATFYASAAGRLRTAVPFLRDGLTAGQPCFLVASGDLLEQYLKALEAEIGKAVDEAIQRGQLVIAAGPGTTVEEALAFWEEQVPAATSRFKAPVARAVGDMTSEKAVFPTVKVMLTYEQFFSVLARRLPSVTICQYDVREFDGPSLLEAMKAHPDDFDIGMGRLVG
ncbi:MAG TPA: MEDS domain-containing protein [Candidatus Solibacter sp.]|nr:MEDS domain-containing protein [Candidatus Solibacter sp.]